MKTKDHKKTPARQKYRAPVVCLITTGIFLAVFLVFAIFPCDAFTLGLTPSLIKNPLYWYTLLSYVFLHMDLFHWFQIAFAIILAGFVVEPRVSKRFLVSTIVGSAFFGGVLFTLTGAGTLVGSVMIAWGLTGLVFACWLKLRHGMHWPEHAITGYLLISTLFRLQDLIDPFNPSAVACYLTLLLSFGFATWRIGAQKDQPKNKETTSQNQRVHPIADNVGDPVNTQAAQGDA